MHEEVIPYSYILQVNKDLRLFLTLLAIFNVFLFSNCRKEEDSNLSSTTQSTIFYQVFSIDSTDNTTDTIFYDIDGDFNFDFELTKAITISNQTVYYSGSIKSIVDTTKFTYLKNSPVMDFVEFGDLIFDSANYDWYDQVTYSGSGPYVSGNQHWSSHAFTDYFGFQLKRNGNLYFGWFQMKHFQIKEIGFNKTANGSIAVGQKR